MHLTTQDLEALRRLIREELADRPSAGDPDPIRQLLVERGIASDDELRVVQR